MDLQVKCLNKLGKGTKRVTFRPFRDRIKLINVNIHRRLERSYQNSIDVDDMNTTHFASALTSWSELNLTSSFNDFLREARKLNSGASLPLLLHHKKQLVDLILDHASRPNCQCAEALLDLIATLALDLRQEFMSEFSRVLLALFDRIDPMQPALLEAIFTCIAKIFKYLLRYLTSVTDSLYIDTYCKVLTHKKPYIREFAAETFAFLLRKVAPESRSNVISAIIEKSSYDNSDSCEGLCSLFFHCFKLQGRQFHSCMGDMLPHVLASSARAAPKSDPFVTSLLIRMNEMTEVQYCDPICNSLFKHAVASDLNTYGRQQALRCLRIWIANRRGSRISDVSNLSSTLDHLIQLPLNTIEADMLLLIAVSLTNLNVNPGSMLRYVFKDSSASLNDLVTFIETVRSKLSPTVFKIALHQIERYCKEKASLHDAISLLTAAYHPESSSISYKTALKPEHATDLRQILLSDECTIGTLKLLPNLSHDFGAEIDHLIRKHLESPLLNETALAALEIITDRTPYIEAIVEKFQQSPCHLVTLQALSLVSNIASFISPETLVTILTSNLSHPSERIRYVSIKIMHVVRSSLGDKAQDLLDLMLSLSETVPNLETERSVSRSITQLSTLALDIHLPCLLQNLIVPFCIGIFRIKFRLFWPPVQKCLGSLLHVHSYAKTFMSYLEDALNCASVILSKDQHENDGMVDSERCTDAQMMFSLMMNVILLPDCNIANSESNQLGQLLLKFIKEQYRIVFRQHRVNPPPCFVKHHEKHIFQQLILWTKFLGRIKKPNSLSFAKELHEFILDLLPRSEPELQRLAVEALLLYRNSTLLAHKDALLALCDPSRAKEQMTTLSLANSSEDISPDQRQSLLPIIFMLVLPKLSAKGKQISSRNAALTFVGAVSDSELDLFIRMALGPDVLANPLSMRLSLQSRFVDVLNSLHRHFTHRLHVAIDDIFRCLGKMISHHGAALKKLDDCDDSIENREDGGVVSRDILRRLFYVVARLADFFPNVLSKQSDSLGHIISVVLLWAPRMKQELTQARTGLMDFIIALSNHVEFIPILQCNSDLISCMLSVLSAHNPVQDVVHGVIQFANNLIDSNCLLSEHILILMSGLQSLLCNLLQSESVPSLALDLLNRLAPLVLQSEIKQNSSILIQLLLKFIQTSSALNLRIVVKSICSLIPLVPEQDRFSYFSSLHRLLLTVADAETRSHICDIAAFLHLPEAKCLQNLNSFARVKLETEPDFELRSATYASLAKWDNFRDSLPLFSQLFFDLVCSEDSIRRHAEHCLSQWALIVSNSCDDSPAVLHNFIFPQIRTKISKVRCEKVLLTLVNSLSAVIAAFPKDFGDLSFLISIEDLEADILRNLFHIQNHRRRRAMGRIRNACNNGLVSERCASSVIRPLLLHFLYKATTLDSATADEVIRTFSDVCARQSWSQYKKTVLSLIHSLKSHSTLFNPLLKTICSLVDGWGYNVEIDSTSCVANKMDHNSAGMFVPDRDDSNKQEVDSQPIIEKVEANFLLDTVLPHLYNYLQEGNEIRIFVAMAIVRILRRLPQNELELRIPRLISMIMSKLSSKEQSDRDAARVTLCAVAADIGPYYLSFIIKEMMHYLNNGFKLHVLAYTLHALLLKLSSSLNPGSIDSCLSFILEITGNDLFSKTDDIPKQTRESRKRHSFHTVELIASNVTFTHHNLIEIIEAYRGRMESDPGTFSREVLRNIISRLAAGLRRNSTTNTQGMLVFIYSMLQDNLEIDVKSPESPAEKSKFLERKLLAEELVSVPKVPSRDLKPVPSKRTLTSNTLLITLGLHLFEQVLADKVCRTKSTVLDEDDSKHHNPGSSKDQPDCDTDINMQSLLDPFLSMLLHCIQRCGNSEVSGIALRAFSALLHCPFELPSMTAHASDYARLMIATVQKGSGTFASICLRGLTALLRFCGAFNISDTQLSVLIEFVNDRISDISSAPGALALLKAILSRKLLFSSLNQLMIRVQNIIVNLDDPSIKKSAQTALIQYLLDYPLSAKRVEQMLRNFVANMSEYPHYHGRLASVNTLQLCALRFPQSVLDHHAHLLFMSSITRLINESSQVCRSKVENLIKTIIDRVSSGKRNQLVSMITLWWQSPKITLQTAASHAAKLIQDPENVNSDWLNLAKEFLAHAAEQLQRLLLQTDDIALQSKLQEIVPIINHSVDLVKLSISSNAAKSCLPAVLKLSLYPDTTIRMKINELFDLTFIPAPIALWADAFLSHFCSDIVEIDLIKASGDNLQRIVLNLFQKQSEAEVITRILHRISARARRTASPEMQRRCFQWMSDFVDVAPNQLLKEFPEVFFAPADSMSNAPKHSCKRLAEGILQNLSQKLGTELFLKVSTEARTFAAEKRRKRKITAALEAVKDPVKAALRKEKRSQAKKRRLNKLSLVRKNKKLGVVPIQYTKSNDVQQATLRSHT